MRALSGGRAARGLWLPGLFTLAAFVALIGLGAWQTQRLAWKTDLIARLKSRAASPPISLDDALAAFGRAPSEAEFLRVRLRGEFLHGREAYLYAILPGGYGWNVVTPLRTVAVLVPVLRGVVPDERKSPQTRPQGQETGTVEIIGRVRLSESPNLFTPKSEPARRTWFARDLAAMTPYLAPPDRRDAVLAPFFVELESPIPPGGIPRPAQGQITLRNDHLGYAITWFGLAAALVVVFVAFARSRLRGVTPDRREAPPSSSPGRREAARSGDPS